MLLKLKIGLFILCSFSFIQVAMAQISANHGNNISFYDIRSTSDSVSESQCMSVLQPFVLPPNAFGKLFIQPIVLTPVASIRSLDPIKSSTNTKTHQWQGISRISLDQGKTFIDAPFNVTKKGNHGKVLIPGYCQAGFVAHKIKAK